MKKKEQTRLIDRIREEVKATFPEVSIAATYAMESLVDYVAILEERLVKAEASLSYLKGNITQND